MGQAGDRGNGMKWRVMVELTGRDGTVRAHEVSTGGSDTAECSAATVGLTLADGKRTLAGLQDCTARSFWDIGLNPTPPRRSAEAAAVETVSA